MFSQYTKYASLIAVTMIGAGSALATETRVQTLRGIGGVSDETQIYTYPGLINQYKVALVELGTYPNTEASAAAFTNLGTVSIGAAVSRSDWLYSSVSSGSLSLFDRYEYAMLDGANGKKDPYLYSPTRPIEVFAGFNLGAGSLGLRLAFASYKNNSETSVGGVTTGTKHNAQDMELAVGYHSSANGSLDVALTLNPLSSQKRTDNANASSSSTSIKGGTYLTLDARWLASTTSSSPFITGKFMTRTLKATGTAGNRDFSSTFSDRLIYLEGGYVAIAGNNGPKLFTTAEIMQLSSKGPGVTGTGSKAVPSYQSNDEAIKSDALVLNTALSGEMDLASGFGMMAGMKYVVYGDVTESNNTTNQNLKTTVSFPETSDAALWSLGMYYKVNALRIDASYSKDFLYHGPYLIAGNTTTPLFGKISASYTF